MTLLLIFAAVALGAVALLPGDPRALIRGGRERRDARLALPGFVEAVGAGLGAGLSLELAIAEVAPTLPAPLDACARRAAASLRLGRRLEPALAEFDRVVPAQDLAVLRIVLGAFHRAGGPVRRRLDRVAALLRGRLALEDEQHALTAQGRVSAVVLVGLVPLGALLFAALMPSYAALLLERGRGLLAVAVLLEAVAIVWLARIVRTRPATADLATLLDAVVVGLDAGLTFERALRSLIERKAGVGRSREARALAADLALGVGRARAFGAFAAHGGPEARVAAIVSAATRLGAPLAELLVLQADSLR
ncbi:MAG TPA: type II secretion system F family protein, partial [Candidatus Limnocylindria bacterium]|nr:type II secretion system F family protein [Candidatus Limnocylindria bacterium]